MVRALQSMTVLLAIRCSVKIQVINGNAKCWNHTILRLS